MYNTLELQPLCRAQRLQGQVRIHKRPGTRFCQGHYGGVRQIVHRNIYRSGTRREFHAEREEKKHTRICQKTAYRIRRGSCFCYAHERYHLPVRRYKSRNVTDIYRQTSHRTEPGLAVSVHCRAYRAWDPADRGIVGAGDIFFENKRQNVCSRKHNIYVEDPAYADGVLFSAHGGRYSAAAGNKLHDRWYSCQYACPSPARYSNDDILSCPYAEAEPYSYRDRHRHACAQHSYVAHNIRKTHQYHPCSPA